MTMVLALCAVLLACALPGAQSEPALRLSRTMAEGGEEAPVAEAPPAPEKGTGVFAYPDGGRYEGGWIGEDGVRYRDGSGVYSDGVESYDGEWVKDRMEGNGKFTFATGATYEGGFVDNKFDGEGVYRWKDGAVYEGSWRQSKMHGAGTYTDPEGVKWEGTFHNGKFDNGRAHIQLR